MEQFGWSVKNGDLESVKDLLEKGTVDVNGDVSGRCPLHFAADYGHSHVIEYLLSKGAKVNVQDSYGLTPLHSAAYEGHEECVKKLIEKGALVKPMPENFLDNIDKDGVKTLIQEKLKTE